jgi:cytochrome c oxidase assembly factor CtaG
MTLWIEWVLCGVVLAVVVYCLFDQILQEAKKEEDQRQIQNEYF